MVADVVETNGKLLAELQFAWKNDRLAVEFYENKAICVVSPLHRHPYPLAFPDDFVCELGLNVMACLVGCHQILTLWSLRCAKSSGYRRLSSTNTDRSRA